MSRRSVLMEALGSTPRDLARTLRRVGPEQALARPDPDGWCIAQVVAHFGEVEGHYLERLRRVVAEDNPTVPALHPDPSAHALERPLAELLASFLEGRAAMLAFLATLEQHQWGRRLVHETGGPTRLRDQVQALVGHDNEHLAQIATLRELLDQ